MYALVCHIIELSQHNLSVFNNYDSMQTSLNWIMYKLYS